MKIFNEKTKNGDVFSWRKAGTAMIFLVFGFAVCGNQISTKFAEMPTSYLTIIAGVFVFYFGKDAIRNFGVTVKKKDDGE